METNSSGEEPIVKVRKPYTIKKQRERWTEEEHNKFLEALKLYGRAWQRIEEHVGTKTAVQIRSHAQKFFTKLEKEAVTKGVGPGQAHEIDIPPPRPKRKPSCPYPRKSKGISVNFQPLTVEFPKPKGLVPSQEEADASHEKNMSPEKSQTKEISENGSCSEILTLFQEVPCASSISSVNRTSPVKTGTKENKSPMEEKPTNSIINTESSQITEAKISGSHTNENQPENPSFVNYHGFSPFLPNCHCNNLMNTSSTFSTLLMSTLLQNPAVHAAARLAASYWTPPVEGDATNNNTMDSLNPNPSLVAIAGATVAAASAWWAAHGLLPFFPPPMASFPFAVPAGPTNVTSSELLYTAEKNHEKEEEHGGVIQDSIPAILTNGSNKRKKQDPSSCGSNTPSTSDVETDNIPGKQYEKAPNGNIEIIEGLFENNNNNGAPSFAADLMNPRRGRSSTSANESVSEEGRLAFQALFKREVLPQSFSPFVNKENNKEMGEIEERESNAAVSTVNLNENPRVADLLHPFVNGPGPDLNAKMKAQRTGFKPYKRCSVEAKGNRATAGEESSNKRIRFEGETST